MRMLNSLLYRVGIMLRGLGFHAQRRSIRIAINLYRLHKWAIRPCTHEHAYSHRNSSSNSNHKPACKEHKIKYIAITIGHTNMGQGVVHTHISVPYEYTHMGQPVHVRDK